MIKTFDFASLKETEHMLRWLAPDPIANLRKQFETILTRQVPGSVLLGIKVHGKPDWLTGAVPNKDDPSKAILSRTGVAFLFTLSVKTPDGTVEDLTGVFTWVGVHLNERSKAQQRNWFDLNGDLATLGANGELKTRMYFA